MRNRMVGYGGFVVLCVLQAGAGFAETQLSPKQCRSRVYDFLAWEPEHELREQIVSSVISRQLNIYCLQLGVSQAGIPCSKTGATLGFEREPNGRLMPALLISTEILGEKIPAEFTMSIIGHEFGHFLDWRDGRAPKWIENGPDYIPNEKELRELFVYEVGAYLREAVRDDRLGWLAFFEYRDACQSDGFWGVAAAFASDSARAPLYAPVIDKLQGWARQAAQAHIETYIE
jgi:hypothetical protein